MLPHRSPTTPMSTLIGLASSAFARHYLRNHYCFLFLRLLRCFSSAGLRLLLQVFNLEGFPIRTSADQRSFAPSRSFSQLTTSFVASGSQGIPHTPLIRFLLLVELLQPFSFILVLKRSFLARLLSITLLYFSIPSLVNELFVLFYPLSGISQAKLHTILREEHNGNICGVEPSIVPLNDAPRRGMLDKRFSGWVEDIGFEPMTPSLQS
jgi:hypothetical protein